jgi:hypothetical protein
MLVVFVSLDVLSLYITENACVHSQWVERSINRTADICRPVLQFCYDFFEFSILSIQIV